MSAADSPAQRRSSQPRSRVGCLACRSRKKKCDEARPRCSRCTRTGKTCAFDRPLGVRIGNKRRGTDRSRDENSTVPGGSDDADTAAHELVSDALPQSTSDAPVSDAGECVGDLSIFNLSTWQWDELQDLFPDPTANDALDSNDVAVFGTTSTVPEATMEVLRATAPQDKLLELTAHLSACTEQDLPVDIRPDEALGTSKAYLVTLPEIGSLSLDPAIEPYQQQLLHHFFDITSRLMIACDSAINPIRSHIFRLITGSHLEPARNPALFALLSCATIGLACCYSAIGLDGKTFKKLGKQYHSRALRLLADQLKEPAGTAIAAQRAQMIAGTTLLLVNVGVGSGDTRMVPLLIDSCMDCLQQHGDPMKLCQSTDYQLCLHMLSSYSVLAGFSGQNSQLSYDIPFEDPLVVGASTIWGYTQSSWSLLRQALLILRTFDTAKEQQDKAAQLSGCADATELESLIDIQDADLQALALENPRVTIGTCILRLAIRVLLLREIFSLPAKDHRVQSSVKASVKMLAMITHGQEIGLILSIVILGASALSEDRQHFRSFIKRAMWRGSSGPRIADQVLQEVWKEDDGKRSWRECVVVHGAPIFV